MSDNNTLILLQEKIAFLQATIRKMQDEKLRLQSDIDMLNQEKLILMNALDQFTEVETENEELKKKAILLEAQLQALLSSLDRIENEM